MPQQVCDCRDEAARFCLFRGLICATEKRVRSADDEADPPAGIIALFGVLRGLNIETGRAICRAGSDANQSEDAWTPIGNRDHVRKDTYLIRQARRSRRAAV